LLPCWHVVSELESLVSHVGGWPAWARSVVVLMVGAMLGAGGLVLARWPLARMARVGEGGLRLALDDTRAPLRLLAPLLGIYFVLPAAVAERGLADARRASATVLILAIGWLLARLVRAGEEAFLQRLRLDVSDNLRARKIHTQLRLLRRLAFVGIGVFTLGSALFQFEEMRRLSTGLLASAGVAGIVLGFAAQRTLGNFIAGVQIALTQPIRLDDVVIVENEWGRIEEITLTYVVVRIWDLRRLVLPIQYFLETPFQNWTRVSSEILAIAYVYVDYRAPVEAIRARLGRILEASEHWDGKVWRLHVSSATDRSLELRALMTARDSPTAWELHCEVREALVAWIRDHHPEALPRVRAEMEARAEAVRPEASTPAGSGARWAGLGPGPPRGT